MNSNTRNTNRLRRSFEVKALTSIEKLRRSSVKQSELANLLRNGDVEVNLEFPFKTGYLLTLRWLVS